ncbi:hypothetical protein BMMGA3_17030 (plasmid) [Bacillus methanolicus MGA3]|uniref:Uncharacterized protein n=1 Tax=Bacillus methanolicus (strain MGA3 / ATCC 53907) TaxID=796606 RepID=A0A068LXU3_BACMM|nr:hypothetical protein BMMGA3_17030 [Bacillus methanolicus MGA3]
MNLTLKSQEVRSLFLLGGRLGKIDTAAFYCRWASRAEK